MPDQPKDLETVRRNAKLFAALQDYMERAQCAENLHFYLDHSGPETLHRKYLDQKNADESITIAASFIKDVERLAHNFADPEWRELIRRLKANVKNTIEVGPLVDFYKSPEYVDYVKAKMGDPRKAARLLGIKNVKLLEQAMLAAALGEKADAEHLLDSLARKEHMREEADAIRKHLAEAGFM